MREQVSVKLVQATLASAELGISDVQAILREAAAAVSVESGAGSSETAGNEEDIASEALKLTRRRYIEWGAALGTLSI